MRARWLSLTLVAGLMLGACGDDGSKVDSKAGFIAAADTICAARDASAAKLAAVRSDADLGRLSGELANIYDTAIEDVQALELPPGTDRAGAQKFVQATAAMSAPVDRVKAASLSLVSAAKGTDRDAVKAASEQLRTSVDTVQALGAVADGAARDYGMRRCGEAENAAPVA